MSPNKTMILTLLGYRVALESLATTIKQLDEWISPYKFVDISLRLTKDIYGLSTFHT